MKQIEKKRVRSHKPDRAPLCGFITYIDAKRPVLLRRIGWEVSDDIHDDFADSISEDNGRTWNEPRPALSSHAVEGGHIVHTENAALYLPERDQQLPDADAGFARARARSRPMAAARRRRLDPRARIPGAHRHARSDGGRVGCGIVDWRGCSHYS